MRTKILSILIICSTFTACCCQEPPVPTKTVVTKTVVQGNKVQGTVTDPWAETMHDTVNVPGHIDQTNTYYRAPSKTVVEIRPGKYSGVQYDGEKK